LAHVKCDGFVPKLMCEFETDFWKTRLMQRSIVQNCLFIDKTNYVQILTHSCRLLFIFVMDCASGATSSSFRGGQFSWNFIRLRHRTYPTVVKLFRKRSCILIMHFWPQNTKSIVYKHTHCAQRWLIKTERFTTALEAELPVSSEISDFTPYAHAKSNILHIKYAEKTDD